MQFVVCMKWGTVFSAEYVNRLYRSVMRNVSRETRVIAFTDDASGLDQEVISQPIPPIHLPADLRPGPWRKLALWSRDLGGLTDNVLFLDLDVVITGPLDGFFDYEPGKLCLIRNWTQATDGIGNSSVMRFKAGSAPHLLENFERDGLALSNKFDNEQIYLTRESRLPLAFWPEAWCPSFKHTMMPRWPLNLVKTTPLPPQSRIVVFTGIPRPAQALRGEWPAPWYKKHYKSIRPIPWIADHWR